jgi:hypothetical protein
MYTILMCWAGNQPADEVGDEDLACRATNDSTSGFTSWGASSFIKWTINIVRRLINNTNYSYSTTNY